MDLALLRTFVTVHRAGSFTRAAALLGLSQPAVTSQIRTLERQLGRPLFLRQARGVTPTTIGDELAHKAAPHLDALVEIAETGLDDESSVRTLHLAGPPEFTAERALPSLTEMTGAEGQGLALRASFGTAEEVLDGLAAGHHDLAITTARPRGALLTATPLCDEEHVLVAAPSRWRTFLSSRSMSRCPSSPATGPPSSTPAPRPRAPSSSPTCARSWPACPRVRVWPYCPAICARPPWTAGTSSNCIDLQSRRSGPTSWWCAPAHWRCRTSHGRTTGC
jgi:hypothetical protein